MSNTFGNIYRLTTFGESHGPAIGGIIDGFPAGFKVDTEDVQRQLDRRRPGQSSIVTQRRENDKVTFLSGLFDGVSTGTPIGFLIPNDDSRSCDYDNIKEVYRPSHADFTYEEKYGLRDYRGGGRASARETASRVVGGALAMQYLRDKGITVRAFTSAVGPVKMPSFDELPSLESVESNPVRCPHPQFAADMEAVIKSAQASGDTVGGIVSCIITGVPAGLGEPIFSRLSSMLAGAMLSINATKGFEYGMGFEGTRHFGSEMIDEFGVDATGRVITKTNHSGGIQGGISNGMPINFNVAFKPVATLLRDVVTVGRDGRETVLKAHGRHDPCVVPRAVPIVEAMAAMVLLDAWLMNSATRG